MLNVRQSQEPEFRGASMHRSSLHAHVTARGRRERQTAGFVRVEASVGEDGRGLASTSATPLSSARTIARSALPHWAPRRAHRRRRAAVAPGAPRRTPGKRRRRWSPSAAGCAKERRCGTAGPWHRRCRHPLALGQIESSRSAGARSVLPGFCQGAHHGGESRASC